MPVRLVWVSLDAAGRRAAKHVNGATTQRFVYGTGLQPLAELDAAGTITARYIYASHNHVPDYLVKNGTTYRIVHDQLGSPRLIVDTSTGAIAQRLDYDVWGNTTTDTNPGFQPFGYAGGLHDLHTKLLRFGARDYQPTTGRWTTRDPIGFAGGDTNLYAYVNNNPVNYVDPTGEILFLPVLAAAWAAAEIALAVADAISTASVVLDECASGLQKAGALGLFALGALAPGGGYSTAAKTADDGVTLSLKYMDGWTPAQRAAADAKVDALNSAAQRGELVKTPVQRTPGSQAGRLRKAGVDVPTGSHGDHLIDLQLGGSNSVDNLWPLDGSVNSSLGAQIGSQLGGVPYGTCVVAVRIC